MTYAKKFLPLFSFFLISCVAVVPKTLILVSVPVTFGVMNRALFCITGVGANVELVITTPF